MRLRASQLVIRLACLISMESTKLKRNLRRFREINWDMADAWTSQDLHDLHWYPGTFPPQIPRLLVSLFSDPGDRVLDPFCGIGTTLLQCIKSKRFAVGIECNPVGYLASSAKILRHSPSNLSSRLAAFRRTVDSVGRVPGLFDDCKTRRTEIGKSHGGRDWFHADTWIELNEIWCRCATAPACVRALVRCAFSSILKPCSGQREHWGYVADNMRPKRPLYFSATVLFTNALLRVERQIEALAEELSPWAEFRPFAKESRVLNVDVRHADLPEESVDLIVTSPPYAGVTDYARSQRLTFEWFDWDLEQSSGLEVGARWKRFRKNAVMQYLADMQAVACRLSVWLRKHGVCVCVIGQSNTRNVDAQISDSFLSLMENAGLHLVSEPVVRRRSRQRVVNRSAEPSQESLYVFSKV